MKEITIRLIYDLSFGSNCAELYSWLDDIDAIECGSNCAHFKYLIPDTVLSDAELTDMLRKELTDNIKFKGGDRIYVIREDINSTAGKSIGSFIIGKRKDAPWVGFGNNSNDTVEEGS